MIKNHYIRKIINLYLHALRINDRTTRADYFGFNLLNLVFLLISWLCASIPGIEIISTIWAMLITLPTMAVIIRRLHDSNHTGLNLVWILIPMIGWVVIFYFTIKKGTKGSNKYGKDPRKGRKYTFSVFDGDLFKKL